MDNNYQRFIIFAPSRAGSWMLNSLLSSHDDILCLGEVFHEHEIAYGPLKPKKDQKFLYLRNSDRVSFLKNIVFKKYPSNIKGVGFKYLYYQMRFKEHSELNKYLKNDIILKIIHLKRKNDLNRIVSFKLAEASGQWRSINKSNIERVSKIHLTLSYKECLDFFRQTKVEEEKIDKYFSSHQKLTLTYEDLVKDMEYKTRNILSFLGLKLQKLTTEYLKQNKRPQSVVLENYWELK